MPQCADGSEYLDLTKKRMQYFNDQIDKSTLPEAEVRGKIARNNCYQVCHSWTDFDKKEFVYICMINANSAVENRVSFADVCKAFHWKTFEFTTNFQTIVPVPDPAWDEDVTKTTERMNAARRPQPPATSKFVFKV